MIGGVITCWVVGATCIVLGIINMCGNINTLHAYHRKRVRPEDVKKLGKLVGIGTILCGAGVISLGSGMLAFDLTSNNIYMILSYISFGVLMGGGIITTLVSICKYNKGLF